MVITVTPFASVLALRHADDQPVEIFAHRDLARQARIELGLGGKAEHARLLRTGNGCSGPVEPRGIDIDVAGGAGTLAAAVGIDAGHVVVDRTAHDREADRHLDQMLSAIEFDVGDLGHLDSDPSNRPPSAPWWTGEGQACPRAASEVSAYSQAVKDQIAR